MFIDVFVFLTTNINPFILEVNKKVFQFVIYF